MGSFIPLLSFLPTLIFISFVGFFYLNKVFKKIDGVIFVVVYDITSLIQALGKVIWSREVE